MQCEYGLFWGKGKLPEGDAPSENAQALDELLLLPPVELLPPPLELELLALEVPLVPGCDPLLLEPLVFAVEELLVEFSEDESPLPPPTFVDPPEQP